MHLQPRTSDADFPDQLAGGNDTPRPGRQIRARPQTREETPEMGKVVINISMSLDGFITEPSEGVGNPLGDDPGRLHDGCSMRRRRPTLRSWTRSTRRPGQS